MLLEVNLMGDFLMEIFASRNLFGFSMAVLGSTKRPTNVNKLDVTALKHIMTPLFVTLEMFALVVPYLFTFLFVTIMTDQDISLIK